MACLEHHCTECQCVWFDNNVSRRCPECGGTNTTRLFDEACDDVDTPDFEEDADDERT